MSRNLEALTSWNPVGLFRSVMGQLYLLPCYISHLFVEDNADGDNVQALENVWPDLNLLTQANIQAVLLMT
jgi:hypothetical protein